MHVFLTVAILHQFVRQIALTWQLRHYRSGNFDYPKFVFLVSATFLHCRIRKMIPCKEKHQFLKKDPNWTQMFLLAFFLCVFALVSAVEELSVEQLNGDNSEDKLEQYVYDQDVDDILQWIDNTIENRFKLGNTLDGLERSQHTKYSQRLDGWQIVGHFACATSTKNQKCWEIILNIADWTYSKSNPILTTAHPTTTASIKFQNSLR